MRSMACDALADGRPVLKVRVRAAASDGEANAALARLIAKALDVPPRDVILAAGATGRIKRLVISGDRPTVAALESLRRMQISRASGLSLRYTRPHRINRDCRDKPGDDSHERAHH